MGGGGGGGGGDAGGDAGGKYNQTRIDIIYWATEKLTNGCFYVQRIVLNNIILGQLSNELCGFVILVLFVNCCVFFIL